VQRYPETVGAYSRGYSSAAESENDQASRTVSSLYRSRSVHSIDRDRILLGRRIPPIPADSLLRLHVSHQRITDCS
jgi:hypothetical protein